MANTPHVRVINNIPVNIEVPKDLKLNLNSLVVKILLLILAMNLLGFGLMAKVKYLKDSSCSEPTVGVVTEVVNRAPVTKHNKSKPSYYAMVQYEADGKNYTYELFTGEFPDNVGKQYNLLYNSEHPQIVALNTGSSDFISGFNTLSNGLFICSGVCFLLVVIPTLITKARKRRAYINDEEYEEAFIKKQKEKLNKNSTETNPLDDPDNWNDDLDFRPPVSDESYYDPEIFGKYFDK